MLSIPLNRANADYGYPELMLPDSAAGGAERARVKVKSCWRIATKGR